MSTHPSQSKFVDDWYVALDVIFLDVKEQLCFFRSILPMTKNGCEMAGEKYWIIYLSFGLISLYLVCK